MLSIPMKQDEFELIDYNFYVDDILHISPPSNSVDIQVKMEAPHDEFEEPKIPELMSLNSVLVEVKGEGNLNFQREYFYEKNLEDLDFEDPYSPTKFCIKTDSEK